MLLSIWLTAVISYFVCATCGEWWCYRSGVCCTLTHEGAGLHISVVTALNQLLTFFQIIPAYVIATSTRQLTAISPICTCLFLGFVS